MADAHPTKTPFCGVYAILNLVNGRAYIGSAVDVRQRWVTHRYALRKGVHGNKPLYCDWVAQDGRGFLFVTLRPCDEADLIVVEQQYIDVADNPYNLFPARRYAGRSGKGKPKTAEHKEKIRAAEIGRPKSREAVEKMRRALTGKPHSKPRGAEWRAKLSVANAGQVPWIKGKRQSVAHHARIHAARQKFFRLRAGEQWPDILL